MHENEYIDIVRNGKILKKNLKKINKDFDFVLDELNILNKKELRKIKLAIFDLESKNLIIKEALQI